MPIDQSPDLFGELATVQELRERPVLSEHYVIPPFSTLDTRQGYWQNRARWWKRMGIVSYEGREHVQVFSPSLHALTPTIPNGGTTSIFDPVLAECLYRWFCPPGGHVLDPYAGGSVRGIVAAKLGLRYTGIDLSEQQVMANRAQAEHCHVSDLATWIIGDSTQIESMDFGGTKFDAIVSCPPYGDMEVYSNDPRDISNMTWENFSLHYAAAIYGAATHLADNRFSAYVIADPRDKETTLYHDLSALTREAHEVGGMALYNSGVLLNALGSAPSRAARQFGGGRKLVRCHQDIRVYIKGDWRVASEACKWPEERTPNSRTRTDR